MKVLKPGRPQTEYSVEQTCTGDGNGGGGCGAVLLVEYPDMRYLPGVPGDTWGSRDPAVMFRCCSCGVVTDMAKKDWPHSPAKLPRFSNAWRDGQPETVPYTGK
jgi:hypothetical protein